MDGAGGIEMIETGKPFKMKPKTRKAEDSQKQLMKERLKAKRDRGTLGPWPDDIDAGRL